MLARGREVYVAEGCINCHSQFIRPGVPNDVLWWGPARPLAVRLAGAPPLLGLRRQGPDLANVGNRRAPEWQRLHLIAPAAVSPGSRMPAYAHLFKPGDARGEALLAYLADLGADTLPERLAQTAAWTPAAAALAAPYREPAAQTLFRRWCASCHGNDAHGDGPLAARLTPPPDFSRTPWRHLPADEPAPENALARIIKFGVPGTAMAGHEYLDDAAVVTLARYVRTLHR
jgi:cytochrome c oxidase cbb3-type subunit 2